MTEPIHELRAVPAETLPEPLRACADPKTPLPDAVREAYAPPAHAALNMARMGLWFTFSIGALGLVFSLVGARTRALYFGIVLVLCALGLLWVRKRYRDHAAAGGDRERLGLFLLPEGILSVTKGKDGKRTADFLPRESVTGFDIPEGGEPYDETKLGVLTENGRWTGCEFDSITMLHPWHTECLQGWRESGSFSWDRYKKPKNPAADA